MCITRILRLLPPERAHRLTLWGLKNGLGPKQIPAQTTITLFGKSLPSFVGLSGGADKNAEALAGWKRLGFGFVEAGTVTLEPRAGNAGTRIWRQHDGASLVNWMGLPNLGLEPFAANLADFQARSCFGVWIGRRKSLSDRMLRRNAGLIEMSSPRTETHSPEAL